MIKNGISGKKHIHFVGIKGVAMTALAVNCKESGSTVTGSDVAQEFPTDSVLRKNAIPVFLGFEPSHIDSADTVIYTGAHEGRGNIEVQEAIKRGIPTYPHGKALGEVMQGKRVISVAGCHGKTTTTSLLATILVSAGRDPSYAIGSGEIIGLGLPGHSGNSDLFVAEADEYVTDPLHDPTPRFLWQSPEILVITNIDFDHPDVYKNLQEISSAYEQLVKKVPATGYVITCFDDSNSQNIHFNTPAQHCTYGFSEGSTAVIEPLVFNRNGNQFILSTGSSKSRPFTLHVPGKQNILNATAAILACRRLGLSDEEIAVGVSLFGGAKRRFETLGIFRGATFIDDYAHHPTEIAATLSAAREWFPTNKIIVVFQPHTVSRTKTLVEAFSHAFMDADSVVISEIYTSAREKTDAEFTGETFASSVKKHHLDVTFCPTYERIAEYLEANLNDSDVVLFMGAGDVGLFGKRFITEHS